MLNIHADNLVVICRPSVMKKTNLHVSKLVGGATNNWIGAYRVGPENVNDQFAWIDGSPLVYAPWNTDHPNPSNSGGNEFCVVMFSDNTWNDYDCWSESHSGHTIKNFVCQSDGVPKQPTQEGINEECLMAGPILIKQTDVTDYLMSLA